MTGITLQYARESAKRYHAGQLYGRDRPYTDHLDHVVQVLDRFGVKEHDILCAGYLHDIIEDTDATLDGLLAVFSQRTCDLVNAVTDGEGETRAEKKQRPYRLILRTPDAVILKLADRIANVEACRADGQFRLLGKYKKEHEVFRVLQRAPTLNTKTRGLMWSYLEVLLEVPRAWA